METYHKSVMLEEALENLNIKSGGLYIDCNLGGGGHAKGVLQRGGKVLGVDIDCDAIEEAERWSEGSAFENLTVVQGNFADIARSAAESGFEKVDGILFDLGVSSRQLENPERGFSYGADAPLDMRMSREFQVKAADLINGLDVRELEELFRKYGEENFARQIARAIVEKRANKPFTRTKELVDVVRAARPRGVKDHIHPAARVFQALRIAVNDELNCLESALPKAAGILNPGGRLVVISFHSLEDRVVKNFVKEDEGLKIITVKPLTPSYEEITVNPRARSAKMRVAEKT
jgi:16S rRNA (cytosine1402-N4)-methyltransferase